MNHTSGKALTIEQVSALLSGQILSGKMLADKSVYTACGCDLMSDVLAFTKPGSILLTGLTNAQVIRTAEMLDLKAIVFVRSKIPDEQTVEMAKGLGIALISTPLPLYESCGILYEEGLSGCQAARKESQTQEASGGLC